MKRIRIRHAKINRIQASLIVNTFIKNSNKSRWKVWQTFMFRTLYTEQCPCFQSPDYPSPQWDKGPLTRGLGLAGGLENNKLNYKFKFVFILLIKVLGNQTKTCLNKIKNFCTRKFYMVNIEIIVECYFCTLWINDIESFTG